MTQDIIDGKLDKRRKGVYGPPMGYKAIIFVDDLNMPEVETYGAQPPIELLRQLVDSGGWYDLKEMTWRTIIDTVLVAAMGPPGGGRNHVTPRFLRHFNLMCFAEFDDGTLVRIFSTIVEWYLTTNKFAPEVQNAKAAVVAATLDTYRCVRHGRGTPCPSSRSCMLHWFSTTHCLPKFLLYQPVPIPTLRGVPPLTLCVPPVDPFFRPQGGHGGPAPDAVQVALHLQPARLQPRDPGRADGAAQGEL
jgi:hypothetical protein